MLRVLLLNLSFLCLLSGFLTGCKEGSDVENLTVPRLLLEVRGVDYGGLGGNVVTLPMSRTSIAVMKEPLITEFDIVNVDLVKVDLGLALLVQVSPAGARQLYRASVSNMGGRIVLTVNGNAIGARRIDGAIGDGNLYTFVEIDEAELGQLVLDIKETLLEVEK